VQLLLLHVAAVSLDALIHLIEKFDTEGRWGNWFQVIEPRRM
jgi:hypothetical protein